ncbi:tetratricopeptide repeat protein [Helicobacter salomonis]|uniref:tetratricopeptide repeat protein n=1 Tax=Helicobacter salomonis TaxID=56878 RepID=UPI000CF0C427|nr:tetratricopeptide repeat protein [Helicobacter salomonis]
MTRTAKHILKIAFISLCCVASLFAHDTHTKAQQIKQYLAIANKAYDNYERAVVSDYAKALQYFKKAGDMGYAGGYFYAGAMYENGSLEGIPKDYAKAMQYYQKAADMGEPAAYNNLGIMYAHGKGVKRDKEKARQYYQKACNMGFDTSCQLLKELKHKN